MLAGPLANVLTSLVIWTIQAVYGPESFAQGAWRVAFFISGILVILGFWTRRRVEESPAFLAYARKSRVVERTPLRQALSHNFIEMMHGFFVKAAENTFL
jgi:Na+/melibiose symporter-like transporter